ncbi:hypothetical protein KCP73_11470 [Salmonella enterica subsp. enterica]|nr:hypothetical protein KCP73_11470 [Salmonella enterica subsp. enterica]
MIALGCSGWMADFGEYPTDTYLHNGVSAEIMRHNALGLRCGRNATTKRYRRPWQTRESPVLYACGLHRQSEIFHHDVGRRPER